MSGFIVVFDDEQGITYPYGWDPEVDGGLGGREKSVAVFPTRKDARRSIRISAAAAKLAIEQGKLRPDGSDFVGPSARFVEVWKLESKAGGAR